MNKLLITLMLISPFSFADWGDIYYCQMTSFSKTTLQGKKVDYKLEKFQFKLDESQKAMVFGSKGYFANVEMKIAWSEGMSNETWEAARGSARLFFHSNGSLGYANVSLKVTHLTANCDKF